MARDRNTYAKQAREVEKRRKAEEKRTRRRKKTQEDKPSEAADSDIHDPVSESELAVTEE